ncbi:UDP-N-acetylmuramate--alanine ligase/UDP-N-acetylmuramate: L-alanyl-gamma-D-glutamyl-meso-diaminopimelate ligase [Christiangramia gaetbulicola]|uniref:UDP-N-acetylmuramate--alanine ligase/UDP-N-acetylmuramate: L-alanyl-gamma-D-glutamyl-meso-diaminopimelate ligase n=1 Tax=Christiangramia gaetbulicola TaxID=703340 RepID=A0A2T6ADR6_9FLAO|nr:Mur ligase family protein [Christiangramia gaetbulicola]PTX41958.1 UDP-N-acetylmuramate--alanine ligase/UDP-N-acetylmuramate: L-alanyl-gamma-D-glutamyl-meso-diaminopimelate ligase [Christiangramia gaetbulicola]
MRIHFIAIGGSAMHSLAIALTQKDYQVTGSDDAIFEPSKSRLKKFGLLPDRMGWYEDNITSDLDAVILGMHAKADNPELLKAKELGIKIFSYPEFLYEQAKDKTRVVIGGSHGKTSITSMILHVMKYHDKEIDYMVGAALEGIDNPVHLTQENDFIVIEGDEYLSSPIDRRPKFHLYQPNIALLSGIAWDHINVFPTYENYVEQFRIFIDSIVNGGILVYNEEDAEVKKLAEETENPIRKHPYQTPEYHTDGDHTILDVPEGELPLEIFGKHNLNNLAGAKWICQHMGIDEDDFYEAIATFKGASKRLEKLAENNSSIIFKDFAHSPSKVSATTAAVKEQFSEKKLIACLELHTFSSLNAEFLKEYRDSLEKADEALVFYSPEAIAAKKLDPVSADQIMEAFSKEGLRVFVTAEEFKKELHNLKLENSVLLMMSSGNYGGLDMEEVKAMI